MSEIMGRVVGSTHLGSPVELLLAFFALALVPVLAICVTSFTRIVVVLGLLRAALGSAALPPNSVLVALAIMLTGAIMAPTLSTIERDAVAPYESHQLTAAQAIQRGAVPLQSFMLRQVRNSDLAVLAKAARVGPVRRDDVPFMVLAPAFLVSELRTAFAMGFALALPFAIIDVVVGVILMSLGMFMVSPSSISMPLKLLLFVAVDGWTLVAGALAASYR
ncbi:MAG TPA: flagellar type III secretion system pore protein FliP [Candidatus Acidoferrales bacterium]|nr:flagellar type III secretion system pore protein FliP [Candidatus Acidoferrales bacterium]